MLLAATYVGLMSVVGLHNFAFEHSGVSLGTHRVTHIDTHMHEGKDAYEQVDI